MMAGVPTVFQVMVAGVLPSLTGGAPLLSQSVRVNRGEGDIAGPLAKLAEAYSDLTFGSYPFLRNGIYGAHIVIRGVDGTRIDAAMAELVAAFPDDLG